MELNRHLTKPRKKNPSFNENLKEGAEQEKIFKLINN